LEGRVGYKAKGNSGEGGPDDEGPADVEYVREGGEREHEREGSWRRDRRGLFAGGVTFSGLMTIFCPVTTTSSSDDSMSMTVEATGLRRCNASFFGFE
jgi:hypothetical protein